jgi:hypothetical protein
MQFMKMTPEQRSALDEYNKAMNAGRGPLVDMRGANFGPGQKEVAKDLAGPVGQRAEASLSTAEGAVETMNNANMVREALNKGQVIAGPMAGVRMKWAQLKNVAGFGDTQQLESTRTAIQGLASLTLDSRASLKGQGQITEGETKLLERARSGNIEEMTVDELQVVVDVSQRLAERQWGNHQHLLGLMRDDPAAQAALRYYQPRSSLPGGVRRGSSPSPKKADPAGQAPPQSFSFSAPNGKTYTFPDAASMAKAKKAMGL